MWAQHLILILNFVCFISISTAENFGIVKIPNGDYSGFRCGSSIFLPQILEAALQEFLSKFQADHGSSSRQSDFPYPQPYSGTFGFLGEHGSSLLWPLIDPENYFLSPDERSKLTDYKHFLVLEATYRWDHFHIIGVVEKLPSGEYLKCVKEPDLSATLRNPIIAGFQCSALVYPNKIIAEAVTRISHYKLNPRKRKRPNVYPSPMNAEISPYKVPEPIFTWPIQYDGKFNYRAIVSIVIDEDTNFIGMASKKLDKYLRCRPTSQLAIKPRFIHSNIMEAHLPLQPGEIDVFQCDKDLIKTDYILGGTHDAIEGFKSRRQENHRKYPRLYAISYPGDDDALSLYLWPLSQDGTSVFDEILGTYKSNYKFFVVYNDFLDIFGVLRKNAKGQYEPCKRKSVSFKTFLESQNAEPSGGRV